MEKVSPEKNIENNLNNDKKSKPNLKKIFIVVFVAVLLILIISVLIILSKQQAEWITYSNEDFNFSFEHPQNWTLTESVQNQNEHDRYKNLFINIVTNEGDLITFSSNLDSNNAECKLYKNVDLGQEKISFANKDINIYYAGNFGNQSSNTKKVNKIYLSDNYTPCYDNPIFHFNNIGYNAYGDTRSGTEHFIIKLKSLTPIEELDESKKMASIRRLINSFRIIKEAPPEKLADINEDISSWNTFNHESGYSFKYPNEGRFEVFMSPPEEREEARLIYDAENDRSFGVRRVSTSPVLIETENDIRLLPLEEFVKAVREENIKSTLESAGVENDTSEITTGSISEQPSYEFEASETFGYGGYGFRVFRRYKFIFTEYEGSKYIIFFPVGDEIGEKILSTLKFP